MEENWGIIGHQNIINFLEKTLAKNKLVHTYLFYGIKHLGKTAVALKFAEKILGSSSIGNSDFFELKVEEGSREIKINQIRDWQRFISLKSFSAGYKIGLISQAEALNRESANALLKTIEEPPEKTIIILVSSTWEKLLPTIVSRSQRILFLPVALKEIKEEIQKRFKDRELEEILKLAGNRPGLAIKFLIDEDFKQNFLEEFKEIKKIGSLAVFERFKFAEDYLSGKNNSENLELVKKFISRLEFILREELLSGKNRRQSAKKLELAGRTKSLLHLNVQARLLLENLLINL